jgi:hypothetical protein
VVVFSGSIRIDGEVDGDVVSLSGPVTVNGLVNGDVVSLNGTVVVTHAGHVTGDVVSREAPVVQSGGEVQGQVRGVGPYLVAVPIVGRILWWIPVTVSTLLLGLILLWLFPRGVRSADLALRSRPLASMAWGIAIGLAVPAVAIVATASLIGIPLGIGILLSLGLFLAAGYTIGACEFGGLMIKNRPVLAFLAGWGILRAAALVPFAGGILWALATIAGLGGASVAVWRARHGGETGISPGGTAASGSQSGPRGAHRKGAGPSGYDPRRTPNPPPMA